MKIGIVTEISYGICNYGNVLQAYALNRYLRDTYGHDVYTLELVNQRKTITRPVLYFLKKIKSILRERTKDEHILSDIRKENFKKFFNEQIPTKKYDRFEDLYQSGIEIYIVGADVVWHQEHFFINSLKFLDFSYGYNPIRISYAASFGKNWIPDENIKAIRSCLAKFRGISVREQNTQEMLGKMGINAKHVLDPVFLLKDTDWSACGKKPNIENLREHEYIFIYLLTPQKYEIDFAIDLLSLLHIKMVIVPYNLKDLNAISFPKGTILCEDASPEEWVWLIEHSQVVITDSFHAIAFSMIFNKEFYAMNRNKMMDRIYDILEKTGSKDRLIYSDYRKDYPYEQVDYDVINQYIESKREYSVRFIDESLSV